MQPSLATAPAGAHASATGASLEIKPGQMEASRTDRVIVRKTLAIIAPTKESNSCLSCIAYTYMCATCVPCTYGMCNSVEGIFGCCPSFDPCKVKKA